MSTRDRGALSKPARQGRQGGRAPGAAATRRAPPATVRTSAAAATMDCLLWKYMERAGAREASCRAAGLAEHCMAGGQAGGGVSVTPHFATQDGPARQPRRRPHLHRPGGRTGHNHGRHAAAAVVIYA